MLDSKVFSFFFPHRFHYLNPWPQVHTKSAKFTASPQIEALAWRVWLRWRRQGRDYCREGKYETPKLPIHIRNRLSFSNILKLELKIMNFGRGKLSSFTDVWAGEGLSRPWALLGGGTWVPRLTHHPPPSAILGNQCLTPTLTSFSMAHAGLITFRLLRQQ